MQKNPPSIAPAAKLTKNETTFFNLWILKNRANTPRREIKLIAKTLIKV